MKPITPLEAKEQRINNIPPEIIEAVNELIVERLEIKNIKKMGAKRAGETVSAQFSRYELETKIYEIFERTGANSGGKEAISEYMDFEIIFRQADWEVTYDTIETLYTFENKRWPAPASSVSSANWARE